MPLSFRTFLSTGQATYPIGFNYLSPDHVQVLVNGVVRVGGYTLANGNVTFTSPIPANGTEIRIYRTTPGRTEATKNTTIADFVNGSTLSETDLDNAVKQNFYLVQEAQDTADGILLSAKAVTEPLLADGAVSTRTIQDKAVLSEKIADGEVKSGNIATGSVTTAKIADAGVTEPKVADNAVSSRTIVTGAVTEAKIEQAWRDTVAYENGSNVFTGSNQFNNSPVVPLVPTQLEHATSKQYVDIGDSGYQGTTPGTTVLPIGSILIASYYDSVAFATYANSLMPHQSIKVWRHPDLTLAPTNDWASIIRPFVVTSVNDSTVPTKENSTVPYALLSGTWRSRGHYNFASGADYMYLVQRVS